MVRVYVDMAADLFHYGHIEFLKQARALGDYLLVGVHGDDELIAHKRKPILTMAERVACVAGCRYVDEVLPNAPWITDRDWIEKHGINLVVHGTIIPWRILITPTQSQSGWEYFEVLTIRPGYQPPKLSNAAKIVHYRRSNPV